jgi:hypothetical protein
MRTIQMMFRIDGKLTRLRPNAFYGGRHENSVFEYLYRLQDGRWFFHTVNVMTCAQPTFAEITEDEAVGWLIRSRRAEELSAAEGPQAGLGARIVPDWVVPPAESFQYGSHTFACPPPVGQHVAIELPRASRTWNAISQRQSLYLEPDRVLQNVMWPAAADVLRTADFRQHLHDPLVTRLQGILEARLLEGPRLSTLQSLQDRGVDLLIEWPHRAKCGVQLKSHGDVEGKDFASHTLMQIQDSRQHGLKRLYVVIAADIRELRKGKKLDNANSQKVRGLLSRISTMNDPYVVVVPPERAWTLLFTG